MTKTDKNYIIWSVNQILSNRCRILTVEFNETVRDQIFNLLGTDYYRTTAAFSGNNILNLIDIQKPEIILLSLDEDESHDMLDSLIATSIPVIVTAAAVNTDRAVAALRKGAAYFVCKPVEDSGQLKAYIEKCIENSRLSRQNKLYIWHLENELEIKTAENERKNRLLAGFNRRIDSLQSCAENQEELESFGGLCRNVLNDFGKQLQATGGSVYTLEEKGLKLVHTLEPRHVPDFLPFPLNENSVFKRVLESGKPVLVDNIDAREDMSASGWKGYTDSSFMIFPIPDHEGNISGILSVHNKTSPPFAAADKEIGQLISSFYNEINRAMKSGNALSMSEAKYRHLTEHSNAVIFSFSVDAGVFDFFNDAVIDTIGIAKETLINKGLDNFVDKFGIVEREDCISHFENLLSGRATGGGLEYRIVLADGRTRDLIQKAAVLTDSSGFPVSIEGIICELAASDEADAQFSTLVKQKEILLNEVNHRVKNNLQIVSSMLNLQTDLSENEHSRSSLISANNRIASMSLVHDNLYEDALLPSVDLSAYIEKLIANLINSSYEHSSVEVKLSVDEINLDLDRAIYCGLIINEAVTNSFNHAFTDSPEGEIEVIFRNSEGFNILTVKDNGSGFTPETKTEFGKYGLGMELIFSLAEQLGGMVDFMNGDGTTVILKFPQNN